MKYVSIGIITLYSALLAPLALADDGNQASCPQVVPTSDHHSLLKLSNSITQSALTNLPVSCVEDIAPSETGADYKDAKDAVATNKNLMSDDYLNAWTFLRAAKAKSVKVSSVYDAADKYNMPPVVLIGAMMQESILDNLPLTEDFGNWACGMGQLNVNDWCSWVSSLSYEEKQKMDWPQSTVSKVQGKNPDLDICDPDFLKPEHAKAFHTVLMGRLAKAQPGAPEYMMDASYAVNPARIQYDDVKKEFDHITAVHLKARGDDALSKTADESSSEQLRFEITRNFVENCLNENHAAAALAFNLKKIFDGLPKELREAQQYHDGQTKMPKCERTPATNAYPLQVGWLLADAVYNAGDEILPGVYSYKKKHHLSWEEMTPQELIHAIDYSLTIKNSGISPIGAKEAVDHIRGVVSSVTIPGQFIAK